MSIVVALVIVSAVTTLAAMLLSSDDFEENHRTDIADHEPEIDITGNGWVVELGEWEVYHGNVKEKSDIDIEDSSDYRALLDAGAPDVTAVVSLKIEGGDQFWGTVVRHSGDPDWIMAFHDGVGDIVLGKKRPDENLIGLAVPLADPTAGGFQELGRLAVNWHSGQTHTIGLKVIGSAITVYADEIPVLFAIDDDFMTSGMVGVFSRGDGSNKLESFTVDHN